MTSEWTTTNIGALVDAGEAIVQTGPFGSQLHKHDYASDGVPVIPTEAIGKGRILDSTVPKVSTKKSTELARHRLQIGDILFARRGAQATGLSAIVDARYHGALCGTGALLLRVSSPRVTPHYLSLYLSSDFAFEWLRAHAVGAVMPNLNTEIIKALPLTLPPIRQQVALSEFLGALDDRIALLRETNAILEAIAQALFKSWFVDFDPVRAKAEGRSPDGMSDATAALFPDAFEDSELGPVPRGWKVSTVGNCVTTVGGATPDTKNERFWQPAEHRWTSPKDLSGATSPLLLDTERRVSSEGLARIGSGLLPRGTLLMSSRAPIGYLAITAIPVAINQGYIAIPPGSQLAPLFMYFWCKQNMNTIKDHANGSTFMEISKKAFRPLELVVPPEAVVESFLDVAEPLFNRIEQNERQAQTLATLRDTLLPRLISGLLRLPEAATEAFA